MILSSNFLGLDPHDCSYESSAVVVLPVPFERTTSYGGGTVYGPAAILDASHQVEFYDEELGIETCERGIVTLPPICPTADDMAQAIAEIEREATRHLTAGKFLVVLGGEHSLTLGPVRAAERCCGPIGVVQFDAHADLRADYEGSPYSHASVMRRIVEDGVPTLAVGIRALSRPEGELIAERKLPTLWGYELADPDLEERFLAHLDELPERIYLTFDIDFFDPSLVPGTGTPEPGGGSWWPTLRLLKKLFERKDVVAMDVVELAPIRRQHSSDFVAARLVYKCLGYHQAGLDYKRS